VIAVGKLSGGVGNFAHVDPTIEEEVCRELGLGVEPASNQIVQRDRHAEFCSLLAVVGASLERFAFEAEAQSSVDALVGKGDEVCSGQREPICEIAARVRGLSRVLRSNGLAALENVALWHERDISHSSVERVILPDSTIALDCMVHLAVAFVEDLEFDLSPGVGEAASSSGEATPAVGTVRTILQEAGCLGAPTDMA
jgi:adenylosuccinate lyase